MARKRKPSPLDSSLTVPVGEAMVAGTRLAGGRITIDNAVLGRKTAVMFCRTSAVEYVLGRSTMLTPLEKAVIELLLDKLGEPFNTIRQQLSHATIAERRFTGVGFFIDFVVPLDSVVRRNLADTTIGDVGAQFPGLQHGAGFLLFIRGGVVTMLEGYTYDEPWPTSTDEFTVHRL